MISRISPDCISCLLSQVCISIHEQSCQLICYLQAHAEHTMWFLPSRKIKLNAIWSTNKPLVVFSTQLSPLRNNPNKIPNPKAGTGISSFSAFPYISKQKQTMCISASSNTPVENFRDRVIRPENLQTFPSNLAKVTGQWTKGTAFAELLY